MRGVFKQKNDRLTQWQELISSASILHNHIKYLIVGRSKHLKKQSADLEILLTAPMVVKSTIPLAYAIAIGQYLKLLANDSCSVQGKAIESVNACRSAGESNAIQSPVRRRIRLGTAVVP